MGVRRAPAVQSPPVGGKGSADRHHLARGVVAGFRCGGADRDRDCGDVGYWPI